MDQDYDVIVLGTGFQGGTLAGLLAKFAKINPEHQFTKILLLDREKKDEIISECKSLSMKRLYNMFHQTENYPSTYGDNREWNIDLIPKFVLANGLVVKLFIKMGIQEALNWMCIEKVYVYQVSKSLLGKIKGSIHKVPQTPKEALSSGLMSLLDKSRCKSFMEFVEQYNENDQKTWKKYPPSTPFQTVAKDFSLNSNIMDFLGHAVALNIDENFLTEPLINTVKKMQVYYNSLGLYGNTPFLYPINGLSGLPFMFERCCLCRGGVSMRKNVDEILFDENGKFKGIRSGNEIAKAKYLITDPLHIEKFGKVKSVGKVIRCICLLDHPVIEDAKSCQIILPQKQLNRHNDIFIISFGSEMEVCPKGFYLAFISTKIETSNPREEIKPALDLLGNIVESFERITDLYEPIDDKFNDNIFVFKSLDPLSHFENDVSEIFKMYEKITGQKIDVDETN
jgi:Rab GDP dissociation inhibitor